MYCQTSVRTGPHGILADALKQSFIAHGRLSRDKVHLLEMIHTIYQSNPYVFADMLFVQTNVELIHVLHECISG